MTRKTRRPITCRTLATSSAVVAALALTACGAPAPDPAPTALSVAPAATVIGPPAKCSDGQPQNASFDPGNVSLNSSAGRMGVIKKDGKLRVGVSGDAKLWGASDPTDGNLTGFDVDVAKRIASALDVQVEYVVLPLSGRLPALIESRDDGGVDLVAERLSMTCARWEGTKAAPSVKINMSSQYYSAGQRLLVRSDAGRGVDSIEKLPIGTDICAVAGSTSLAKLQSRIADAADLKARNLNAVVASDSGQCLVKFQEGEAAAITADDTTLAGFANQDPNARVVGDAFTREYYGLGTSPGASEFTRYVNAVLAQMRTDGTLRDLYAKWMAKNVDPSVQEPAVPVAVYGRDLGKLTPQS